MISHSSSSSKSSSMEEGGAGLISHSSSSSGVLLKSSHPIAYRQWDTLMSAAEASLYPGISCCKG